MKDIPIIRGHHYIASAVAEGEHAHQDFKYMISDARKIARSISAFANASGGHLLIGVKDNGTIAGVRNEEDIYVVEQAASRYCDPPQTVDFTAFRVEGPAVVIRATVAEAASRPVRAQEPDSRWRAYYRVADENIAAHPLMLRMWRLQRSLCGGAMAVGGDSAALLAAIERAGSVEADCRALAVELGLSLRTVEDMVVRLAAIGVLRFSHKGSFRVELGNM